MCTKINVLSAAVGAFLLALVLVATGAVVPQGTERVFAENVLEMNSYPSPRATVRIQGGRTYVVPRGKIFVPTALGVTTVSTSLEVDGQRMWTGFVEPVRVGFNVREGATITSVLHGYVVDA